MLRVGMGVYICNPSIQLRKQAEGSQVQGQSRLQNETLSQNFKKKKKSNAEITNSNF
jgi:hypothetical protein